MGLSGCYWSMNNTEEESELILFSLKTFSSFITGGRSCYISCYCPGYLRGFFRRLLGGLENTIISRVRVPVASVLASEISLRHGETVLRLPRIRSGISHVSATLPDQYRQRGHWPIRSINSRSSTTLEIIYDLSPSQVIRLLILFH